MTVLQAQNDRNDDNTCTRSVSPSPEPSSESEWGGIVSDKEDDDEGGVCDGLQATTPPGTNQQVLGLGNLLGHQAFVVSPSNTCSVGGCSVATEHRGHQAGTSYLESQ